MDDLPRMDLLHRATPLEQMQRAGDRLGHPALWVKRDDCMALGLGGNKLRSLEYWLGAAQAADCDIVVVAGGLASNQCRLTAAAAAKLGLDALVLYAGDADAPLTGNALLTAMFGARIRRLGPVDAAERSRLAAQTVEELRAAGRRPYLIGDPVLGAKGYVRAAGELAGQARDLGLDLRHIVMPGSMGPTEAGMIAGARRLGLPWTFHLVSVEYPADHLRGLVDRICADLGQPGGDSGDVKIHMDQLGDGYGIPNAASRTAADFFGAAEALVLEQTYVAKTFAGLMALVRDGTIPADQAACIIHTGGTPSVFA